MAGYSGTPLFKKLGFKEHMNVFIHEAPSNYEEILNLPFKVNFLQTVRNESLDLIHVFCLSQIDLENAIQRFKPGLKKNGMIWISWPKKSSKVKTNLTEDVIRDYILGNGLVDVKVAAVDETWSALKLVYRLKDR